MDWRVSAFTWNDPSTKREIRAANNRKLTLRLLAPSTFECQINGMHDHARLITELLTDVIVRGGNTDMLRARCGIAQDTIDESGNHQVQFPFVDYRGVLMRRAVMAADVTTYTAVEQRTIVWNLVTMAQSKTNGNYSITQGPESATGITRTKVLTQGQFIGNEIDAISKSTNGFDWDVSPAMVLNLYYPQRGSNNGIGLEYGKSVGALSRTKSSSIFGNAAIVTGGTGTLPTEALSATIATNPQGRWDIVSSFPDVIEQQILNDKASWLVARTGLLIPVYTLKLVAGFWKGTSHIGLGDTVRLLVRKGRIFDNMLMRVLEIAIDIGNDGGEEVSMSVAGL